MPEAGNYYGRAYLSPDTIADLVEMPDGIRIKAVNWQEDRQAFILVLEMPVHSEYFVENNQRVPEIRLDQLVITDDDGGRHVRFSWPESEKRSSDAPNDRQQHSSDEEPQEVLAAS